MVDAIFAIKAALNQDWSTAINLNRKLLQESPNDVDALNRLAYAYVQIGKVKEACKLYHQVLAIDRFNIIAKKNLAKYRDYQKKNLDTAEKTPISPNLFIEEPGKAKTVKLVNVASKEILSSLRPAQEVKLVKRRYSIEVRNSKNIYLGSLPDDLSFYLKKYHSRRGRCRAYVKQAERKSLTILVKDLKAGSRKNLFQLFKPSDAELDDE